MMTMMTMMTMMMMKMMMLLKKKGGGGIAVCAQDQLDKAGQRLLIGEKFTAHCAG